MRASFARSMSVLLKDEFAYAAATGKHAAAIPKTKPLQLGAAMMRTEFEKNGVVACSRACWTRERALARCRVKRTSEVGLRDIGANELPLRIPIGWAH